MTQKYGNIQILKKICIHDDIHCGGSSEYIYGSVTNYIKYINRFDAYFGTYSYLFKDSLHEHCTTSVYQLYHCCNPTYINNKIENIDKKQKLLVIGTITDEYKLRTILFNTEHSFIEKCNCTYDRLSPDKFYEKINNYLYVFTCGGTNDMYTWRKYIVSKFFEITYNN